MPGLVLGLTLTDEAITTTVSLLTKRNTTVTTQIWPLLEDSGGPVATKFDIMDS